MSLCRHGLQGVLAHLQQFREAIRLVEKDTTADSHTPWQVRERPEVMTTDRSGWSDSAVPTSSSPSRPPSSTAVNNTSTDTSLRIISASSALAAVRTSSLHMLWLRPQSLRRSTRLQRPEHAGAGISELTSSPDLERANRNRIGVVWAASLNTAAWLVANCGKHSGHHPARVGYD